MQPSPADISKLRKKGVTTAAAMQRLSLVSIGIEPPQESPQEPPQEPPLERARKNREEQRDPWAELRAAVARAQLQDFDGFQKVWGRDVTAVAGVGYTQHGVCSYVYKAHIRGDAAQTPLAIKVMHNMDVAMYQTVAIARTFSAEHELLSDLHRLPPHPNIMSLLRAFTDDASSLPGWDFHLGDDIVVQRRALMLVMPFVPKDLLNLLGATRRAGQPLFGEARAAWLGGQVARALAHLEAHAIVHRDVKLDNILVDAVGSADERAVLTNFGMCFDFWKNRIADCRVPMFIDGFGRRSFDQRSNLLAPPSSFGFRPGSCCCSLCLLLRRRRRLRCCCSAFAPPLARACRLLFRQPLHLNTCCTRACRLLFRQPLHLNTCCNLRVDSFEEHCRFTSRHPLAWVQTQQPVHRVDERWHEILVHGAKAFVGVRCRVLHLLTTPGWIHMNSPDSYVSPRFSQRRLHHPN
eukprot:SAG22_NODE_1313_length_4774_cov_31.746310_2_plen_464_part_00